MTTALEYLNGLRPAVPYSVEKPCTLPSNGELKRWLKDGAVQVNGEPLRVEDNMNFPIFSLVFFPTLV